jgi:hypothetical protein
MPVKPPRSSPTDSTGVAIPNIGTLIEYDAVAPELVREHSWLTETWRPTRWLSIGPWPLCPLGQVGDGEGRSGSQGWRRASEGRESTLPAHRFERALAPGCAEDCGEAFRPMRTRCLGSDWAVGSSVDRQIG